MFAKDQAINSTKSQLIRSIEKHQVDIAVLSEKENGLLNMIRMLESLVPFAAVWYMWKLTLACRDSPESRPYIEQEAKQQLSRLLTAIEELKTEIAQVAKVKSAHIPVPGRLEERTSRQITTEKLNSQNDLIGTSPFNYIEPSLKPGSHLLLAEPAAAKVSKKPSTRDETPKLDVKPFKTDPSDYLGPKNSSESPITKTFKVKTERPDHLISKETSNSPNTPNTPEQSQIKHPVSTKSHEIEHIIATPPSNTGLTLPLNQSVSNNNTEYKKMQIENLTPEPSEQINLLHSYENDMISKTGSDLIKYTSEALEEPTFALANDTSEKESKPASKSGYTLASKTPSSRLLGNGSYSKISSLKETSNVSLPKKEEANSANDALQSSSYKIQIPPSSTIEPSDPSCSKESSRNPSLIKPSKEIVSSPIELISGNGSYSKISFLKETSNVSLPKKEEANSANDALQSSSYKIQIPPSSTIEPSDPSCSKESSREPSLIKPSKEIVSLPIERISGNGSYSKISLKETSNVSLPKKEEENSENDALQSSSYKIQIPPSSTIEPSDPSGSKESSRKQSLIKPSKEIVSSKIEKINSKLDLNVHGGFPEAETSSYIITRSTKPPSTDKPKQSEQRPSKSSIVEKGSLLNQPQTLNNEKELENNIPTEYPMSIRKSTSDLIKYTSEALEQPTIASANDTSEKESKPASKSGYTLASKTPSSRLSGNGSYSKISFKETSNVSLPKKEEANSANDALQSSSYKIQIPPSSTIEPSDPSGSKESSRKPSLIKPSTEIESSPIEKLDSTLDLTVHGSLPESEASSSIRTRSTKPPSTDKPKQSEQRSSKSRIFEKGSSLNQPQTLNNEKELENNIPTEYPMSIRKSTDEREPFQDKQPDMAEGARSRSRIVREVIEIQRDGKSPERVEVQPGMDAPQIKAVEDLIRRLDYERDNIQDEMDRIFGPLPEAIAKTGDILLSKNKEGSSPDKRDKSPRPEEATPKSAGHGSSPKESNSAQSRAQDELRSPTPSPRTPQYEQPEQALGAPYSQKPLSQGVPHKVQRTTNQNETFSDENSRKGQGTPNQREPYGQVVPSRSQEGLNKMTPYGQRVPSNVQGGPNQISPYGQGVPSNTQGGPNQKALYGQRVPSNAQGGPNQISPYGQGVPSNTQGGPNQISPYGQGVPSNAQDGPNQKALYGQGVPSKAQGVPSQMTPYGQGVPSNTQGGPNQMSPYGQGVSSKAQGGPNQMTPYGKGVPSKAYQMAPSSHVVPDQTATHSQETPFKRGIPYRTTYNEGSPSNFGTPSNQGTPYNQANSYNQGVPSSQVAPNTTKSAPSVGDSSSPALTCPWSSSPDQISPEEVKERLDMIEAMLDAITAVDDSSGTPSSRSSPSQQRISQRATSPSHKHLSTRPKFPYMASDSGYSASSDTTPPLKTPPHSSTPIPTEPRQLSPKEIRERLEMIEARLNQIAAANDSTDQDSTISDDFTDGFSERLIKLQDKIAKGIKRVEEVIDHEVRRLQRA